ncbi:MAG TPA: tail fiber domain-containing protein [Phycisphaerales bacterium]
MAMNRFKSASQILAAAALAACVAGAARSQSLPSMQGVLRTDTGQPVNGSKPLKFSLYSSPTGGTALQEIRQTVDVAQGVFTATLGFDPQLFGAAEERWVEIGVQTGPGVFEPLTPRQRIGAAPLALTIPGLQVQSNLVLDQEVPFAGFFGSATLNDGIRWQSFTTGGVGEIRAVDAAMQNNGDIDSIVTATLYRGLGVDGTPVAVTTASIPARTILTQRFTFPAAVTAVAEEVFTVQLSSPGPAEWTVLRNSTYSRGMSNFEPNADFGIATYLSNRAAGSEFTFNGSVTASTLRGAYGLFNQLVQAPTLSASNATITGNVSANTINADSVTANTFNVPTLTSSFFVGQSMALTTNAGIGLTNPSSDVRLEILKQNVGSGWHLYLTNPTAATQFNRTGMRVSDVGFFEITPAIGSGQFARLSGAGNWSAVSDARLKSDVSPAEGLLDAALKLRPVHFRWIADGKRDTGFIAQEVKSILPRFVVGDESKDMLTVDYSHMSVVAIGALQEMHRDLKAENEALRTELLNQSARRSEDSSAKQREIDALKARLERLESMVVSKAPATK